MQLGSEPLSAFKAVNKADKAVVEMRVITARASPGTTGEVLYGQDDAHQSLQSLKMPIHLINLYL